MIVDNFRLTTVLYRYVRYDLFGPPQDLHRQSINISNWTYNSNSEGYGELGVDHAIDLSINYMEEVLALKWYIAANILITMFTLTSLGIV